MTGRCKNVSRVASGILTLLFIVACSGEVQQTEPTPQAAIPTTTPDLATPQPALPTPTPDLATMMTVHLLISASPDGQWKAEALLAEPYRRDGGLGIGVDYARLTVFRVDGSLQWVPYEEWSETGLGDSSISKFHWSADGRYLYFDHRGAADGCGNPFVTDLRRVDLRDGSLTEIALTGLGLNVITVSPDARQMAYRNANGILIYDLERGDARTIPHQWPEGPAYDYVVDWYAWSAEGKQLAFTLIENYCGLLAQAQATSIRVVDLESGEVRVLTEHDARFLLVTGWPEPRALHVDQGGRRYLFDLEAGTLLPDEPPPDPVAIATTVLQNYLDSLFWAVTHRFDAFTYDRAAELYGGSYTTLIEMNPGVDPSDQASLLRNACEVNGFQCLRIREVISSEASSSVRNGDEVKTTVTLMNLDGSVFSLGPCCGEDPTGAPQSEFVFTVRRTEGGAFKVLDLPPYLP